MSSLLASPFRLRFLVSQYDTRVKTMELTFRRMVCDPGSSRTQGGSISFGRGERVGNDSSGQNWKVDVGSNGLPPCVAELAVLSPSARVHA